MNRDHAVRDAFRWQAEACRQLGSPFTGRVCDLLASRLSGESALARRVLDWPGDAKADALALRLCGGLHGLVLSRTDERLAAVYAGREADEERLWAALEEALAKHSRELLGWLDGPPQTNEVARSAMLLPALLALARRYDRPLALAEIGASAGLNLLLDRFAYRYGEAAWGDPRAAVRLAPQLKGAVPDLAGDLRVVSRAGCDRAPVDLEDPAARLRLQAYIWADQPERLARCRAAIDLASSAGIKIERSDAADFVERAALRSEPGVVTVVFHTIVWQYLDRTTARRIEASLRAAGAERRADAPLAWLRFEPEGNRYPPLLTLTTWPDAAEAVLAAGDAHGRWLDWRQAT